MGVTLSGAKWQFASVYFDDFVVFSRLEAEHIDLAKHGSTGLRDARLILKLEKCNLFPEAIDYLCHFTPPMQLEIKSHTTDAMKKLKPL